MHICIITCFLTIYISCVILEIMISNTLLKINTKLLTCSKICYKLHLNFLGRIISKKRVFSTFKLLESQAHDFLYKDYDFSNLTEIDSQTSPIFVMWLQGGTEVMPDAVKKCYESIVKNCTTHTVNLITEENLSKFVELSPIILQKYNEKKITRAFFSDIVRSALLYKYGGTWIDATVYLSNRLPEKYFSQDFFSPCGFNGIKKRDWKYFFLESNGWSAWFMGTNKLHYPLFDFLTQFYKFYFEKNDSILDYFQNDFSISLFYQKNKSFNEYLNNQQANNIRAYEMADFMNKDLENNYDKVKLLLEDNLINKLTYKRNWITEKNGKKTVYSAFLNNFKDF